MPSTVTAVFFIFLQLTQNIGCYAECHCGKRSNVRDSVKKAGGGASAGELLMNGIKTVVVAGAAVVAAPVVLTAAGFGAGGIAAGSLAAGVQSTWFSGTINGITGWMFSGLQSIGAGGLGAAGKVAISKTTEAAVQIYDTFRDGSDDENCDCRPEVQPQY
ncbi:hypothetical protein AVEN_48392-1 [Araneus ventricosus]|uniref:Interferon alpha-inducible protein 27, mitochondrial n=1 Tax=Araneus ventricosus TaxID=182803 RepID=A0A4Y2IFA6_ARAVE|nr:hypothetical protein AVEN_48392-1 [Araneus ventricosus]